jgi:predicted AlkP superfamily pyrophosphatase or phosphodiesterase
MQENPDIPSQENLIIPDYGADSILGISNGILDHFGIEAQHTPFRFRERIPECNIPKKKKVVLLILDAFGWNNYQNCLKDTEFAELTSSFLNRRITSTFPTTTTTALTTLYTASSPIEHGMLGYILYLKRFFSLVNMLDIAPIGMERDLLTHHGFNPLKWLPVKTIFEKLSKSGIKSMSITSNLFKNSALSKMHHIGSTMKGYTDMVDMVLLLKKSLEEEGPLFVFAYWGLSDSFGHLYGPFSREYVLELKTFFYLFRQLFYEDVVSRIKDTDILLLISADHGQTATEWYDEEWIAPKHRLVKDYLDIPPFGEPRALYFIPNREREFRDFFLEHFSKRFLLLRKAEAVKRGFFGTSANTAHFEEHASRAGTWIALSKTKNSLHYRYTGNEKTFKGKHGSLTADEIYVPLLILG